MTVDLSVFEAANGTSGGKCRWPATVATLDGQQRQALNRALAAPHIQHSAIQRVLEGWGVDVSRDAVKRHRTFGGTTECKSCRG